jgi:hypothetical protein
MYVALIFVIARHMRSNPGDAWGPFAPIDALYGGVANGDNQQAGATPALRTESKKNK